MPESRDQSLPIHSLACPLSAPPPLFSAVARAIISLSRRRPRRRRRFIEIQNAEQREREGEGGREGRGIRTRHAAQARCMLCCCTHLITLARVSRPPSPSLPPPPPPPPSQFAKKAPRFVVRQWTIKCIVPRSLSRGYSLGALVSGPGTVAITRQLLVFMQ